MKKLHSPVDIEVLLHCYYRAAGPEQESQSQRESLVKWIKLGCVDPNEPHTITDKGGALVQMILATPLPVSKWSDPRE